MSTIRGKLLVYFLVFLVLFQVTAISIFVSSNKLTNTYHSSFQRFLLLNSISQQADELYTFARTFVGESEPNRVPEFYQLKDELVKEKEKVRSEEHTSELQSRGHLVCRLLLETKNKK